VEVELVHHPVFGLGIRAQDADLTGVLEHHQAHLFPT
jgi:hypothetical protein